MTPSMAAVQLLPSVAEAALPEPAAPPPTFPADAAWTPAVGGDLVVTASDALAILQPSEQTGAGGGPDGSTGLVGNMVSSDSLPTLPPESAEPSVEVARVAVLDETDSELPVPIANAPTTAAPPVEFQHEAFDPTTSVRDSRAGASAPVEVAPPLEADPGSKPPTAQAVPSGGEYRIVATSSQSLPAVVPAPVPSLPEPSSDVPPMRLTGAAAISIWVQPQDWAQPDNASAPWPELILAGGTGLLTLWVSVHLWRRKRSW